MRPIKAVSRALKRKKWVRGSNRPLGRFKVVGPNRDWENSMLGTKRFLSKKVRPILRLDTPGEKYLCTSAGKLGYTAEGRA